MKKKIKILAWAGFEPMAMTSNIWRLTNWSTSAQLKIEAKKGPINSNENIFVTNLNFHSPLFDTAAISDQTEQQSY